MTLASGTKLGSYEVVAPLGAGGMGEVYRAKDTRLGRDVALKVLPQAFARDAERMARFEREAKVLASLNHPNIATIHGLEESGSTRALVMELVEGPTLADRVKSGAIPLDEALPIARQIAEGLEYAHERGIIHRDLKPSNVKMTPDGHVKILDFGLAKALEGDLTEEGSQNSPTLTVAATRAGVLLGTAAYMAPEQARGKRVDRRADIWAFGCVLFEMLSRRRAFTGETTSDILAGVIRAEPDWTSLPANTPPRMGDLLRRCLQKDPRQRLQAIGEARIAIEQAIATPEMDSLTPALAAPPPPGLTSRWKTIVPWGLTAGLIVALVMVLLYRRAPVAVALPVARFALPVPASQRLEVISGRNIAFSPDSRTIAYVARERGTTLLYVRELDQFEAKPLPGTEGVFAPFFSPDSQWLGFLSSDGKLKKVQTNGGPVIILCDAEEGLGGTWLPDGTIVFNDVWTEGLKRVSAEGGKPEVLTRPDPKRGEKYHHWPVALPGGRAILFQAQKGASAEHGSINVLSLKTGEWKSLVEEATNALYLPSGHLLYQHAGALMAVPFDVEKLEITGTPSPVLSGVTLDRGELGVAQLAVAEDGSIVYIPGGVVQMENSLVSVDRAGNERALSDIHRSYEDLSLSPDGRLLAMTIRAEMWNIWLFDLTRGTLTRFTFEDDNRDPIWTCDGKHVVYSSFRDGRFHLFWKAAEGGPEEELLATDGQPFPYSCSQDGRWLSYSAATPGSDYGIYLLPLEGERKPKELVRSFTRLGSGALSPDGKWIAYQALESGRLEIYVQSLLEAGKWQISNSGGIRPQWSRNGHEIFYRDASGNMMTAPVQTEPAFHAATPRALFTYRYTFAGHDYDTTPDGQHFIFIKELETQERPGQINVVLNWSSELKKK